ncbi:hypothetical protein GTA08_BOTSDO00329 [Botryosphaeria dothidea]|uniref:A-kinase anchor protein 7-like phosphoesterase domain-containing protein n=1 Tax=Botryosphaeria dothidea TaxID=55169 RepID=A0A8H4J5M5_9PEZI|nr:hypothetical protein GTA08_BOTSDO00329 [Botryosphaeria dothidea]
MPRRGFGKKGGYKGPVPGPDAKSEENEQQQQNQKPAKKPPLTHFLCVPLVTAESKPRLQESLGKFKEDVMKPRKVAVTADSNSEERGTEGDQHTDPARAEGEQQMREVPGIPGKAIRPVGTLHLTLGVMSLMNSERVQEAVSLLQNLDLAALLQGEKIAEPRPAIVEGGTQQPNAPEETQSQAAQQKDQSYSGEPSAQEETAGNPTATLSNLPSGSQVSEPLVISLKSLVSMHPPRKTSILYAHPEDPTNRLHPFCDTLKALFTGKGLMVEDTRPLKLHATVVNTIYAKSGGHGKGHGPNARAPIRVDATDLLPRYANFVWADEIRVEKIAICKMGAKKIVGEKGDVVREEYEEVAAAEIKM